MNTPTTPRLLPRLLAALAGLVVVLAPLAVPTSATAAPLSITSPGDGSFSTTPSVTVTGTKSTEATVTVEAGGSTACTFGPPDGESWSCAVTLAPGSTTITATESYPDASPSATATVTVRFLPAPAITGPVVGETILTNGVLTGTGYPGATIGLIGSGPQAIAQGCGTVQGNGSWSCALGSIASGSYSIQATQSWPGFPSDTSAASSAQTVVVDRTAPAAPVVTSPKAGATISAQPATYSGTGENAARVEVFIDGQPICQATVSSGAWSCEASGVADGTHTVQAVQRDAAGNSSPASRGISVDFGRAAVNPPPARPAPGTPPQEPEASAAPVPTETPTATPTPRPTAKPGIPFLPPPVGGDSGLPPEQTWGTPTDYGAAIPSVEDASARGAWIIGFVLALAFVALLALPLRLLMLLYGSRFTPRPRRLAGRNQSAVDDESAPIAGPIVTAIGAIATAALVAGFAGGLQGEVRYVRLMIAIAVGIALINLVFAGLARLTAATFDGRLAFRLVPSFLLLATAAALTSRILAIQPPVILGVMLALAASIGLGKKARGVTALVQLATLVAIGAGAWVAHSVLGPVEGFWPSLTSELLAVVCLGALSSAVLLSVPVGSLPGRALYAWSRMGWLLVTLAGAWVAATVIASSVTFPVGWVVGIALVFATIVVSLWAWREYVAPLAETEREAIEAPPLS